MRVGEVHLVVEPALWFRLACR